MKIKNILRKRNASLRYEAMSAVASAATGAADLLCAPPAIKNAKKVLCVQPHPDDNQIGMGGTIAYMRSLGIEVYELTLCSVGKLYKLVNSDDIIADIIERIVRFWV